ncbi:hypothetical protein SAMN05443247_00462 [Bradyrhizobium erythrophlei]|jgi:hypothetical protein|nr:hypothetical protein SAMN05443247_00462 [Bradyrhizobium erythrophlei]
MDPIPGTLVFLAALNCAFRSTRSRIFPFFRRPLWRPANKATAWPPCSWVELQAVLDRPEFWVSQLVRSPTSETGVYREFAADRCKSLHPEFRGNEAKLSRHFKGAYLNRECGSSIPGWSASQSGARPGFPRSGRMGRKSPLFAHSISSSDFRFAHLEVEIAESLRPCPRIFPFCGDYRRRLVRSRLPPEGGVRERGRKPDYWRLNFVQAGRGRFLGGIPRPVTVTGIRLLPISNPFNLIATSMKCVPR